MANEIPQSSALSEATVDSLAEVMSRDPEGLSRQDRDRIIEALRAQRERIAKAEGSAPVRQPRGSAAVPKSDTSAKTAEDLGL